MLFAAFALPAVTVEYRHPGVYVQEAPSRSKPIEGVSTAIPPFLTVADIGKAQVKPTGAAAMIGPGMERDTNYFGSDYRNIDNITAAQCQTACKNESPCKAWTWVKPEPGRPGVPEKKARCWLKNAVPAKSTDPNCISGVKAQAPGVAGLPPKAIVSTQPTGAPMASRDQQALRNVPGAQPPAQGKIPVAAKAPLTGTIHIKNVHAKQDTQRFVNNVQQQNALATSTYNALLTERGAERLVEQGILKPEVYTINKQRPAGFILRPGAGFTIHGRGFGSTGELRLVGLFRNPVPVMFTGWSPSAILARLAEGITGEFDQGNVRLEILPLGGKEAIAVPNLRFEAAREVTLLDEIPQRYVRLMGWPATYTTHGQSQRPESYSDFLKSTKLRSAIVTRHNEGSPSAEWFAPGTDVYALGLKPGFEIASIDFQHGLTRTNSSECHGRRGGEYFQGRYGATIVSANVINVDWGVWRCHTSPKWAGVGNIPSDDTNGSAYALDVYLIGPRGVDPWIR
jgi:hypothetical protein